MKRAIAAVGLLVALLVPSAHAIADDVTPGFKPNAKISAPATWIAGHTVTAYCAPTAAAMNALISPTATNIQGATPTIGGNVIDLSPAVCANLIAWQKGSKRIVLYNFAVSIETLAHEAELAKGVNDETSATCQGIKLIPQLVARYYPLRKRESLHDLMGDVAYFWNSQSSVYHAHRC